MKVPVVLMMMVVHVALASHSQLRKMTDEIVAQAEAAAGSTIKGSSKKTVVKSFSHRPCECDEGVVKLSDVDVVSVGDGRVAITGTAHVDKDVHAISGSVKMELEKGGKRRPVPCVKEVGCCEYPDLCATFHKFSKSSLKCPLLKGNYKLPEEFVIDISKFSRLLNSHTFNITAKAFCDGVYCLCSNINIIFE